MQTETYQGQRIIVRLRAEKPVAAQRMPVSRRSGHQPRPARQRRQVDTVVVDQAQRPVGHDDQIVLLQVAVCEIGLQQPQSQTVEAPGQRPEPFAVVRAAQAGQTTAQRLAVGPLHQHDRTVAALSGQIEHVQFVGQIAALDQIRGADTPQRLAYRLGIARRPYVAFQRLALAVGRPYPEYRRVVAGYEDRGPAGIVFGRYVAQRTKQPIGRAERLDVTADRRQG